MTLSFITTRQGCPWEKDRFSLPLNRTSAERWERALLPDTLEVYPLQGYGAVEIGVHRFHHPGRPEDGVGDAKFVTLWQNKDGAWKVTRVISYNHNHGLLAK
jgi:hypothetical protein